MARKLTTFDFRFGDADLPAESIHALDLIDAIEDWVKALSLSADGKERRHVALVAIRKGSVRPVLMCDARATNIAHRVVNAVRRNRLGSVPENAYKALLKTDRVAKRMNVKWEFGPLAAPKSERIVIARTAEIPEVQPPSAWKGETSIFGRCIRVGGVPATATIELEGQSSVNARVSVELAKKLGARLYDSIGLAGVAEWDEDTKNIVAFEASALLPYDPGPIDSAFEKLAEIAGDTLDGVDAEKLVAELRGEDLPK